MLSYILKTKNSRNNKEYHSLKFKYIHAFSFKVNPYSRYLSFNFLYFIINSIACCDLYFLAGYSYNYTRVLLNLSILYTSPFPSLYSFPSANIL